MPSKPKPAKQARHPIAEKLHAVYPGKSAAAEIKAALDAQQVEVEQLWDRPGSSRWLGWRGITTSRCEREGCNYRRYPVSRFCLYHSSGNSSLAAQLRRLEGRP
jgi:hypothetical protein